MEGEASRSDGSGLPRCGLPTKGSSLSLQGLPSFPFSSHLSQLFEAHPLDFAGGVFGELFGNDNEADHALVGLNRRIHRIHGTGQLGVLIACTVMTLIFYAGSSGLRAIFGG